MFRFEKSKTAPSAFRTWVRENQPTSERAWNELDGDAKTALRTRLHIDQRELCCYCYTRIADDHTSHIEHIEPQSRDNRFDWQNLALACEGGNLSGHAPHCDHAKGHQPLREVHPYTAPVNRLVHLGSKGQLKMRTDIEIGEEVWRHDIEDVLALNASHLQRLRRAAWQAATADLSPGKRRRADWRAADLDRILEELRAREQLMDYQPLIEDWLAHRLRRERTSAAGAGS